MLTYLCKVGYINGKKKKDLLLIHHFLPQSAETATVKTLLYGLSLEAPQVGS